MLLLPKPNQTGCERWNLTWKSLTLTPAKFINVDFDSAEETWCYNRADSHQIKFRCSDEFCGLDFVTVSQTAVMIVGIDSEPGASNEPQGDVTPIQPLYIHSDESCSVEQWSQNGSTSQLWYYPGLPCCAAHRACDRLSSRLTWLGI